MGGEKVLFRWNLFLDVQLQHRRVCVFSPLTCGSAGQTPTLQLRLVKMSLCEVWCDWIIWVDDVAPLSSHNYQSALFGASFLPNYPLLHQRVQLLKGVAALRRPRFCLNASIKLLFA